MQGFQVTVDRTDLNLAGRRIIELYGIPYNMIVDETDWGSTDEGGDHLSGMIVSQNQQT
jgi:hypothetical protein